MKTVIKMFRPIFTASAKICYCPVPLFILALWETSQLCRFLQCQTYFECLPQRGHIYADFQFPRLIIFSHPLPSFPGLGS